jgi:hypothetical protein
MMFLFVYARDWKYEVIGQNANFWTSKNIARYPMDKRVSENY